jgi:hypothetical protein
MITAVRGFGLSACKILVFVSILLMRIMSKTRLNH